MKSYFKEDIMENLSIAELQRKFAVCCDKALELIRLGKTHTDEYKENAKLATEITETILKLRGQNERGVSN